MPGLISPISSSMSVPLWAASNLPIFRSVAPVNAPRSWPNSSLASRSADSAAQLRQTKTFSRRGLLSWTAAGDQLLAHAALAADQHGGVAGGGLADLLGHLADRRAAADDLAADAQPLAQLDVLGAHPGEVLGQFLPAADVLHRHRHRVGHGQGELEVVRVGHDGAVGGIEMDQAEHLAAAADRAQITLVARISPWLSRVPSVLSSITFRASTASPSRITVEARKFDTRW